MPRIMPKQKRRIPLITLIVGLVVLFLGGIPLFFVLWNSFREATIGTLGQFSLTGFTLKNYIAAYSNPTWIPMLLHSFSFAIGSMIIALFLGGTLAYLVERTDAPLGNWTYGMMFVTLVMPSMLKSIAWILLLSPTIGILNKAFFALGFSKPLFNAYSLYAMFWVEGISMTPLTFLLLGATFRNMDPSLEEAAYVFGGSSLQTFMRVTGPMLLPAFAGVALLQMVRGLEAFEVPLIMGLQSGIVVFSTNIYLAMRETFPPDYGLGFSYSMLLLTLTLGGIIIYQRIMASSERYTTITGKAFRARIIKLKKWRPWATVFIIFYTIVGVGLPYATLLYASFLPYYQAPSRKAFSQFTLENYIALSERTDLIPTLKNTLIVCVSAGAGAMFLALFVSWITIRLKSRGSKALDILAFLPYASPSIVTGVGFMVVFLAFRNPIYGTIWILVLAYISRYMPYGTRFTHAGFIQIHKELEEAAHISGASLGQALRRVVIPLMLPSILAGFLYISLLAVKVMSMAAILFTPDTMVLSVLIWQMWESGSIGSVGALSVIMITLLSAFSIFARKLRTRAEMMR